MTKNTVATHASHAFRDSMRNIYNLQRSQVMQHVSKLLNKVNVNPEKDYYGKYYYLPPENSKFAGNLERYLPRRMFDNKLKDHGLYDLYYEFRKSDLQEKNMELGILTKNLTNSDYHNLLQSHSQRQLDSVSKRKECKFRKKAAFNRKFGLNQFSKSLHSSDTSPVRGEGMIRKLDHLYRISSDTQHSPTVRPHITKATCSTQTMLANLDNEKILESKIRDLEVLNQKWESDKKDSETKLVESDQKILDLKNQLQDKITEIRELQTNLEKGEKRLEFDPWQPRGKDNQEMDKLRAINENLSSQNAELKIKVDTLITIDQNRIKEQKFIVDLYEGKISKLMNGIESYLQIWSEKQEKLDESICKKDKMLMEIHGQCHKWLTQRNKRQQSQEINIFTDSIIGIIEQRKPTYASIASTTTPHSLGGLAVPRIGP